MPVSFGFTHRFMLVGLGLLVAACSGGDAVTPGTVISIDMRDLAFDPATLTLREDEPVRLEFRNDSEQSHDFSVAHMSVSDVHAEDAGSGGHDMSAMDDYVLHVAVSAGKRGLIDFKPTEPGDYEFVCTVAGHSAAGMRGTLQVR